MPEPPTTSSPLHPVSRKGSREARRKREDRFRKIRNPKFEIRNKSQARSSNDRNAVARRGLRFEGLRFRSFVLVSDFDVRYSCLSPGAEFGGESDGGCGVRVPISGALPSLFYTSSLGLGLPALRTPAHTPGFAFNALRASSRIGNKPVRLRSNRPTPLRPPVRIRSGGGCTLEAGTP